MIKNLVGLKKRLEEIAIRLRHAGRWMQTEETEDPEMELLYKKHGAELIGASEMIENWIQEG